MGEDDLKMSKRTKNYKEPAYIFDHYGADAMRWYFFSAQAPWTSVRFQEANIRDAQREFLVRLYNVLSFFTIYANIDGFEARHEGTKQTISNPKSKIHSPKSLLPVGALCPSAPSLTAGSSASCTTRSASCANLWTVSRTIRPPAG